VLLSHKDLPLTATPIRIGFVIESYRRAVSPIHRLPPRATETSRARERERERADPLKTYFAALPDAQARADERQALLSPDRRRFSVPVADVEAVLDLLDSEEVLTARYIDTERGIDQPVIITEIVVDAEAQSALIKVWG
jgi:hypothetical protein